MFYFPNYSFTINESKERFRIVICSFFAIKNIVAPSFSSNFPVKLIFWEILVFIYLDKSMPISLYLFWWYEKSNMFPVCSHRLLTFQYVFDMPLVCFFIG